MSKIKTYPFYRKIFLPDGSLVFSKVYDYKKISRFEIVNSLIPLRGKKA